MMYKLRIIITILHMIELQDLMASMIS